MNTAGDLLVLVLVDGDRTIVRTAEENGRRHLESLVPAVDRLLSENALRPSDLDCVSAVVGPGSFTGIRVGVSAANAFSDALGIPLIEVSSLELAARGKREGVVFVDALRGNRYGGTIRDGKIVETRYWEAGETPDGPSYMKDEHRDYGAEYAEILAEKYAVGEFVKTLAPLYMRESQAEREARR